MTKQKRFFVVLEDCTVFRGKDEKCVDVDLVAGDVLQYEGAADGEIDFTLCPGGEFVWQYNYSIEDKIREIKEGE